MLKQQQCDTPAGTTYWRGNVEATRTYGTGVLTEPRPCVHHGRTKEAQ